MFAAPVTLTCELFGSKAELSHAGSSVSKAKDVLVCNVQPHLAPKACASSTPLRTLSTCKPFSPCSRNLCLSSAGPVPALEPTSLGGSSFPHSQTRLSDRHPHQCLPVASATELLLLLLLLLLGSTHSHAHFPHNIIHSTKSAKHSLTLFQKPPPIICSASPNT
jgi:hypothetical protein